MLTQTPEVRRMAPLEVNITEDEIDLGEDMLSDGHRASGSDGPRAGYNFEPEAGTLLSALLPKYISTRIFASLLDAAASESLLAVPP